MIEIERKYLLKDVGEVNLSQLRRVNIQQGYLGFSPVVRIRISEQGCFLGVKGPGTISRLELEYEVPKDDAEKLMKLSPGRILKKRYFYPFEGHEWEIDVFEGVHQGLLLAEIELKSEDEKFEKPLFIKKAKEVTTDFRYTNAELSRWRGVN